MGGIAPHIALLRFYKYKKSFISVKIYTDNVIKKIHLLPDCFDKAALHQRLHNAVIPTYLCVRRRKRARFKPLPGYFYSYIRRVNTYPNCAPTSA